MSDNFMYGEDINADLDVIDENSTSYVLSDVVTIPLSEYRELLEDSKIYSALVAGGVDNWSGYDFCMEELDLD